MSGASTSRRRTLAAPAASGRLSLAVGRVSRASIAPSSVLPAANTSRRSSAHSSFHGRSKAADPRPIGDKGFTKENVKKLTIFLSSHHCDIELSPRILSAPSAGDFRRIVRAILGAFDPYLLFSDDKFEEELIDLLKKLKYPFNLSKSALISPGAPHAWPNILAMLIWLVEAINYYEVVHANEQDNSLPSFYMFAAASYLQYMRGDDSNRADNELRTAAANSTQFLRQQCEKTQTINQSMQEEISAIERVQAEAAGERVQLQEIESEIEKVRLAISSAENENEKLTKEIAAKKADLVQMAEQNQELQQEKVRLQRTVDAQEISKAQYESMRLQRATLDEAVAKALKTKEKLENDNLELSKKVRAILSSLDKSSFEFNSLLEVLELAPTTAKNANGEDWILKLNNDKLNEFSPENNNLIFINCVDTTALVSQLFTLDLKDKFKEKLKSLSAQLNSNILQSKKDCRELANTRQTLEESCGDRKDKQQTIVRKKEAAETAYKIEKSAKNDELKRKIGEAEQLELSLSSEENQLTQLRATSDGLKQQLETISGLVIKAQNDGRNERASVCHEMRLIMEKIAEHKFHVQQQFQQASQALHQGLQLFTMQ